MSQEERNETIDAEVVDEPVGGAIVMKPSLIPVTLTELAALEDRGVEISKTAARIWHSTRIAAIRETNPEDWVLFRVVDKQSHEERITAYLQDSGCSRIRPFLGVEIFPPYGQKEFNFTKTEGKILIKDKNGDEKLVEGYAFSVTGDGFCNLSGRTVRGVIGTRYSTDADAQDIKDPLKRELRVKGNSRVNMDGHITRELCGLKNVPLQELDEAWEGTKKSARKCPWGRGFHGFNEDEAPKDNNGAKVQKASDVPAGLQPKCQECGETMKFVPAGKSARGNYEAFWSCKDRSHKKTYKHAEVVKGAKQHLAYQESQQRRQESEDAAEALEREPGQEG